MHPAYLFAVVPAAAGIISWIFRIPLTRFSDLLNGIERTTEELHARANYVARWGSVGAAAATIGMILSVKSNT